MTDDTVTDEHRRLYYIQVMVSFETLNRIAPGGFLGALLGMAAGLGRIDGSPTDLSSISEMLGVPRSTLWRKAKEMEAAGFIEFRREGRRMLIASTLEKAGYWDAFQAQIDELIRAGRKRLHPPVRPTSEPMEAKSAPMHALPGYATGR